MNIEIQKETFGNISLINGDCMDVLKSLPDKSFSLAIVDPPYGADDAIGLVNCKQTAAKRTNYHQFKNIAPSKEYFLELERVSKKQIVWGGNFFGLKGGVIVWNKNGTAFGDGEIAICNTHKSVKIFEYTWNGMIQQDMKNKEKRIHPTQKPVALYKWLLDNYAKPGDTILDTHLGSGSICLAAHDLGFEMLGVELDSKFYNAAKQRLLYKQAQLKLF